MTRQMPVKIDPVMQDVLAAFDAADGYATTGYLVDATERSRPTVTKRLDRLHASDCIEYVHAPTAFWRLKDDPRTDNTG